MTLALAILALTVVPVAAEASEIGAVLDRMEAAYARVQGYTARFVRQERIRDALRSREEALLKFQRPGRFYLRWISGPRVGREILFVEGRDDNRVLLHEPGGLAGLVTIALAPDSPRVLRESRHPITDVGLGRLIELIAGNARLASGRGDLTVIDRGTSDDSSRRLELVLPRDPGRGYYCYRALVALDQASGLPVEAAIFDWDDRLVASYAYRDLRLNAELTVLDFDARNPDYGFPRWRLKW